MYFNLRFEWTILLADRTNGRAYSTVMRPSVCLSSSATYVLWLNGAS